MKVTTTALIAASATMAWASSASLPSCADACVSEYMSGSNIGSCGSLDIGCICGSTTFIGGIGCCFYNACDTADLQTAITFAQQICETAGVDVTIPSFSTCAATSAATATATSAGSDSASAANSSPTATNALAVSSSTSTTAAAAPSALSSNSNSTATATTSTSTPAATVSSTAAIATGAGVQNVVSAGIVFIGGLAAVFAFV